MRQRESARDSRSGNPRKTLNKKSYMKIVVIGGTGLIGNQSRESLRRTGPRGGGGIPLLGRQHRHRRRTGASACGRAGCRRCRERASWEDKAVLEFFETSGRNLLAAEAAAGVGHHVALRSSAPNACSRADTSAQSWPRKNLIKASPIPYTIVRATQFFEFVGGIAKVATEGQTVRLPPSHDATHRLG